MKSSWLSLSGGLLAGLVAYACIYLHATSVQCSMDQSSHPELAWLKHEYHPSDAQFAQVAQLHDAYRPKCAEMCRRIDDQNANNIVDCLDLIPNALVQTVSNTVGCFGTGGVTTVPADPTTIRMVRISVVGKASKPDPSYTANSALAVEDHNIPAVSQYRRRVLTRTVSLRDLGL